MKVPVWVRLLDAAALLSLALAAFVRLFGSIDLDFSLAPVRVNSAGELLFVAAAVAAVRHAAHPAVPLHARVRAWAERIRTRPAARAVAVALASRVAVLAVGVLAVRAIGMTPMASGFEVSRDPFLNLPARFDAGWYTSIALDGYSYGGSFSHQENVAFFPAFPLLMRAAGYPLGAFAPGLPRERRMVRLLWGGVAISLAAFAWAAVYLRRLVRDLLGDAGALRAGALLAAYPFAAFYSAPYSESLFLLGAVAAVYHSRRREWAAAGGWGLLVGLTRPNGCFLSVVLIALVAEQRWRRGLAAFPDRDLLKSIVSAAMPGIGMLSFSIYVQQLTGRLFGWVRLHEAAWGRTYQGLAVRGITSPYDVMNALGLVFALSMLWPVLRRLGPALALFILVNVVPPFLAGGLLSMGRLTATLFPAFIALAAMVSARTARALVTAFAIGQAVVAAVFFTWHPLF